MTAFASKAHCRIYVYEKPTGKLARLLGFRPFRELLVTDRDLRGLRALAEDVSLLRKIVVSNELWRRTTEDHIEIIPVEKFLIDVWEGKIF